MSLLVKASWVMGLQVVWMRAGRPQITPSYTCLPSDPRLKGICVTQGQGEWDPPNSLLREYGTFKHPFAEQKLETYKIYPNPPHLDDLSPLLGNAKLRSSTASGSLAELIKLIGH